MNTTPPMPVPQPYDGYYLLPTSHYADLIAERDRWAEAASEHGTQANRLRKENEALRRDCERLGDSLIKRSELIGRIKGVMNEVMDH